MSNLQLKGVVGTPVMPFTEDGSVDRATFERLVSFLLDTGVDALGFPMHIGESLNMTTQERKDMTEAAVQTVAGRVPVLVNVSLAGTDEVIELARHAEKVGADGIIVTPPYHWRPPAEALAQHYLAIAKSTDLGLVVYNYPERFGVEVSIDLVLRLLDELDNFVAVKDAAFNMEYFTELCRVTADLGPAFAAFTGTEYLLTSLPVGGKGAFSAGGAVAPVLVRRLYDACASGDYEAARELQYEFSRLYKVIQVGYPATIKAAMGVLGRPVGSVRKPLVPLTQEQLATLERTLKNDFPLLEQEPQGWQVQTPASR
jgi:4-hydroxy-tetrahydrodipicolinate synthase